MSRRIKGILYTFVMVLVLSGGKLAAQNTDIVSEAFKAGYNAYTLGKYADAVEQYNKAINTDPNRHYLYYNRGLAYKALGHTGAAINDFYRSLSIKQTAEAHYQAGLVKYERKELTAAKPDFENAKMMKEDFDKLNFCLGMIYYREDNFEEALKCFQLYTAQEKNQPEAYYYRGMCEAKLNQYEAAIYSFKFALRYRDNDWTYYYKMYEFYMALNDKENALNSISMVIETGEKKLEYFQKRAELYKELGPVFKYEEDVEQIKKMGGKETIAARL